jgi:hypothetical protein
VLLLPQAHLLMSLVLQQVPVMLHCTANHSQAGRG